jgi:hypothetical protein
MKKLIMATMTVKRAILLIVLAVGLAILTLPVETFAFSFIESIDNYGIETSGYNYVSTVDFTDGFIGWGQTETWGHTLSIDYMTVPDNFTVSNAVLEIQGFQYAGLGGEVVNVAGTLVWTGISGWHWVNDVQYSFDITDINNSVWNSSPLYVSLTPFFDCGFNVTQSVLSVDYDLSLYPGPDIAATPEPTTMLLFGIGLGIAAISRKKKK